MVHFFQKQLVEAESVQIVKVSSASFVSVSHLAGQDLLIAWRYGSMLVDVSIVTCLLKIKFSS